MEIIDVQMKKNLIDINEYIKTCTGTIRKIASFEVVDEEFQIYGMDKVCLLPIYTEDDSKLEALDSIGDDQILKHSKKIYKQNKQALSWNRWIFS